MEDPEIYLKELDIELSCAVAPDAPAVLDARHRVFINYETYFVSDMDRRAEFIAQPFRYTGVVTDPVNHYRFQPEEESPVRTHGGRLFYFSSDATAGRFEAAPDSFSVPVLTMIPKKPANDS